MVGPVTKLAELAGTFCGRVLKECGPELAAIIAEGIALALQGGVAVDGARRDDLRERLRRRVRDAERARAERRAGAAAEDDSPCGGVDG